MKKLVVGIILSGMLMATLAGCGNSSGFNTGKSINATTRNVAVLEHIQRALSGENTNLVLELSEKTYHIFFSSVDDGVLILFLDITEKAQAEKMRCERFRIAN